MPATDDSELWQRCINAHLHDAIPVPQRTAGHVYALVPGGSTGDLDLSATAAEVRDLAAAPSAGEALHDLAEAAVTARLRARRATAAGVGLGRDWQEAVTRGVYDLLELQALRRLAGVAGVAGVDGVQAVRITGCPVVRVVRADALDHLAAVAASLDFYLFPTVSAVPTVGAVLRFPEPSGRLFALACHLDVRRGAETALRRLLRKLAAFTLLCAPSSAHNGTARPVWVRAALRAGPADRRLPPAADGETPPENRPDGPVGDDLESLRGRLAAHGLSARARLLHPVEHLPRADRQATAVRCEIRGLPAPTRVAESVWDPPDVLLLGIRLPEQVRLRYDDSQVRLSRLYHENSKIHTLYRDQPRLSTSDLPVPVHRMLGRATRDFRATPLEYELAAADDVVTDPVERVIRRRRSWAPITDEPLTLAELGHLLRFSYGATGSAVLPGSDTHIPLRAVPAAGGLYSNDLYLLLDRVEDAAAGLYYYHPGRHRLQLVRADARLAQVARYTGYPERVGDAAALVVYVGSLRRLRWKYRERGYRMALLDCGHLAQNVVLMANALDLVGHPMVAYVDDYFNELVGVDGVEEVVLYLTLLGRRAAAGPATEYGLPDAGEAQG